MCSITACFDRPSWLARHWETCAQLPSWSTLEFDSNALACGINTNHCSFEDLIMRIASSQFPPGSEMTMWSMEMRLPGSSLFLEITPSELLFGVIVKVFVGVPFCFPNWQVPHIRELTLGCQAINPLFPTNQASQYVKWFANHNEWYNGGTATFASVLARHRHSCWVSNIEQACRPNFAHLLNSACKRVVSGNQLVL